jgi:parallel beta-helix repeat protein
MQKIGPDRVYKDDDGIRRVGAGLADIVNDSFFFDAKDQSLYLRIAGAPEWFSIEVGVRGGVLGVSKAHDVIVRGFQCRHNRMPGGQWSMCGVGECQRVVVENCKFELSDFCGLGVDVCKDCVVRNCDLSYNGNTGLNLYKTENCTVEDCRLMFNNYRRFSPGWHCGGMKNIPGNRGSIIRRCEAAYNIDCPGIWFDADNADIQVLDNVLHHNGTDGIFIEINRGEGPVKDFTINRGGGVIGGNLVYANAGRGIYISGSQGMWIVHNTVADNVSGITIMPRENPFVVRNDRVLNNLMIRNYVPAETLTRGCDLTVCIYAPAEQAASGNFSDYNVYADNCWTPTMRNNWNDNNTLATWQKNFAMDPHSRLTTVPFERIGQGFRLLGTAGLDVAGPLPPECKWRPPHPGRVGADRTQWP